MRALGGQPAIGALLAAGRTDWATGERVRVFVLNAGPSIDSSFHVVGTIFDTVMKEGVSLTRDNPGKYGPGHEAEWEDDDS